MASLSTNSVRLTIKRKDGDKNISSSFDVSNGAMPEDLYDTAQAINGLQIGELSGYYKTLVSEILPE